MLPYTKKINRLIDQLEKIKDNSSSDAKKAKGEISELTDRILVNSNNINKRHFNNIEKTLKRLIRLEVYELEYSKVTESSFPFSKEILLYATENDPSYNTATCAFIFFVELNSRDTSFDNQIISFLEKNDLEGHLFSYRKAFISALDFPKENFNVPHYFKIQIVRIIGSKYLQVSKKAVMLVLFLGIGEEALSSIKDAFTKEVTRMIEMSKNISEHHGLITVINSSVQDLALAVYLISNDEKYDIPFVEEKTSQKEEAIVNFCRILDIVTKI